MKLAKALLERADLKRKLSHLEQRLYDNARVQEGEEPAENPIQLMEEYNRCLLDLEDLITKINLTNAKAELGGISLTRHLARRDRLSQQIRTLNAFLQKASLLAGRTSQSEIKILSAVNVRELRKEADRLAKELRETDERIQEANWTIELAE